MEHVEGQDNLSWGEYIRMSATHHALYEPMMP